MRVAIEHRIPRETALGEITRRRLQLTRRLKVLIRAAYADIRFMVDDLLVHHFQGLRLEKIVGVPKNEKIASRLFHAPVTCHPGELILLAKHHEAIIAALVLAQYL